MNRWLIRLIKDSCFGPRDTLRLYTEFLIFFLLMVYGYGLRSQRKYPGYEGGHGSLVHSVVIGEFVRYLERNGRRNQTVLTRHSLKFSTLPRPFLLFFFLLSFSPLFSFLGVVFILLPPGPRMGKSYQKSGHA